MWCVGCVVLLADCVKVEGEVASCCNLPVALQSDNLSGVVLLPIMLLFLCFVVAILDHARDLRSLTIAFAIPQPQLPPTMPPVRVHVITLHCVTAQTVFISQTHPTEYVCDCDWLLPFLSLSLLTMHQS